MKLKLLLSNIYGDLSGGVMTTIVALPVAMAFGIASGLGAAAGLYGAMACGLFAAIFGGTRGQQSGPTGPITVGVAALLVAQQGNVDFVMCAIILAGLFQIVFGKLKWGSLAQYIPYPVVSGFMSGIALIIIILHINPLCGVEGEKNILSEIVSFSHLPERTNLSALAIGLVTLLLIVVFKRLSKRFPGALAALAIVTVVSLLMHLDIPVIGEIPKTLPTPALPALDLALIVPLVAGAATIAILGSIDSLLTSVIADRLLKQRHDSNRELIGQGIGNVAAGLIGGLAGAGSTTRTIANIDSGGRTALSGIVYSLLVLLVITQLATVASVIPLSGLAAILVWLGISIIDKRMFSHVLTAPRSDVLVMLLVLFMTVFADLISAVALGTALSCVLYVKRIADSPCSTITRLGKVEDVEPSCLRSGDGLGDGLVYNFSGPLFFGELIRLSNCIGQSKDYRLVVFNFENVLFVDQSCSYFLEDAIRELKEGGTAVLAVAMNDDVRRTLKRLNCYNVLESECRSESWLEEMPGLASSAGGA